MTKSDSPKASEAKVKWSCDSECPTCKGNPKVFWDEEYLAWLERDTCYPSVFPPCSTKGE